MFAETLETKKLSSAVIHDEDYVMVWEFIATLEQVDLYLSWNNESSENT